MPVRLVWRCAGRAAAHLLSGASAQELRHARKFGVIAAGGADFYPCFGTTIECHTVAGQAILEAAGDRVETLAGAPLAYGKPGFKNDGFLAWGRVS